MYAASVICQIYIHEDQSEAVIICEKSQRLTDPHDVNLTDNQLSIHDKLYQHCKQINNLIQF